MRNTCRRLTRRAASAAAAVLLLAAGCSNGDNDGASGRGTLPAATTAPAVTATSATDAAAPATTGPTANVTDVPDDSATPVATVTVADTTPTGTTPTGTTTPVTVGDTTPPVTGTTEPVTSTTGSGPTVPTTLPITDDTTTSTTEADTGDGTEPRNKVDEQYPLGSAARKAYLAASGGVAPVGATVTLDMAGLRTDQQHGRTTADRWPNGYPAAPGSPNYQTTTLAQREAQRAARWVAAMDRSGAGAFDPYKRTNRVYDSDGNVLTETVEVIRDTENRYWLRGVLVDDDVHASWLRVFGSEPAEFTELRKYLEGGELDGQKPPDALSWSFPRWHICGGLAASKNADVGNLGTNTLPCEALLDWVIWSVEQVTAPDLVGRSDATRAQALWGRAFTVVGRALPEKAITRQVAADALYALDGDTMRREIHSRLGWWNVLDRGASEEAEWSLWDAWEADFNAGRIPRELVP